MKVEIDPGSGFCGGVIRAINTAEKYLAEHGGKMYSLGSIVHNEKELARLQGLGLIPLDKADLDNMTPSEGEVLLIRAHGEPPAIYGKARARGFVIRDCTCPVVLKLQKDIREAYSRGQIVIFGKVGHPEVLGLVGQVGGDAVVVENLPKLKSLVESGAIDTSRDLDIFSQTTMSPVEYDAILEELNLRMKPGATLTAHHTICSQVAGRHEGLSRFAAGHDVVVFVSGQHSSNGKVLSDLCKRCNARTFNVSSASEVRKEWFLPSDNVGVSGATSTPGWLLEEVARAIENLQ